MEQDRSNRTNVFDNGDSFQEGLVVHMQDKLTKSTIIVITD